MFRCVCINKNGSIKCDRSSIMSLFPNLKLPDFLIYLCFIITQIISISVFVFSFANCYRAGVLSLKVFLSNTKHESIHLRELNMYPSRRSLCELLPRYKLGTWEMSMC